MSITNKLREYAQSWRETPNLMDDLDAGDIDGILDDIEHIADRIDNAYQKDMNGLRAQCGNMWRKGYDVCHAELMEGHPVIAADLEKAGWVKLPKDADGEAIHIGDKVTLYGQCVYEVDAIFFYENGVSVSYEGENGCGCDSANSFHHYHEPTVDDVLKEMHE